MKPVPRAISLVAVLLVPIVWPAVILWLAAKIAAMLCLNFIKRNT